MAVPKCLQEAGYKDITFLEYVEENGAIHYEEAWSRSFPDAMRLIGAIIRIHCQLRLG
jgi:hypothetical protein